jgi:hypothetical protein
MAQGAAVSARFGSVLLRRAAQIGQRRVETLAEKACIEIGIILPDIGIARDRGRIRLTGRGLRRRWWLNAALRWLGRLLR